MDASLVGGDSGVQYHAKRSFDMQTEVGRESIRNLVSLMFKGLISRFSIFSVTVLLQLFTLILNNDDIICAKNCSELQTL